MIPATLAAMELSSLHALSAADAARLIREGVIASEQYVAACLARVRETDARIEAWAFLDPDHALGQARAADQWRLSGQPIGPLHGVPIAVKDIIDTADMPTENGSPLHAGRTPSRDAAVVTQLRAAGAVIMGKTVTTEFACGASGKTRNPHDPAYSPGGSSSGSAAAVAAGMVPLALGSQTGGSTVRPASYCGIYGLKPTRGLVPRRGMSRVSPTLDTVGLFARSIERGRGHAAPAYLEALAQIPRLNEGFAELFEQRYDALLTPAATGVAPAGLASTGDPVFCSLWTLCGVPALSVPLMSGANGLPLGVQLVGPRHGDGRLLRTARWLVDTLRRA